MGSELHPLARADYDPYFNHIKPPDRYNTGSVAAYQTLSVFGFATCLLLTATILFSKRVIRHKSVPNFFGLLSFSCLMVLITWFSGNVNIWTTHDPPSFRLCLFQSSMIAGISTAQGIAACFLVFQVWLAVSRLVFSSKSASYFNFMESSVCQWMLLASPWVVWAVYAIATLVVGLVDRSTIRPNSLYCATTHKKLVDARHYSSAFFSVLVVLLQLHLAYMSASLYVQSKRTQRRTAATIVANNDHGIVIDLEGLEDLLQPTRFDIGPFVIRVLLFGLYTCFLVAATIYIAMRPKSGHTAFADITNASIAPCAFIVFGSQHDCLLEWRDSFFWCVSKMKSLVGLLPLAWRRRDGKSSNISPSIQQMIAAKSHAGKDVAISLSIDSGMTTESGDSQKQQMPVLYKTNEWPLDRESSKTDVNEGQGNELGFFAALAIK